MFIICCNSSNNQHTAKKAFTKTDSVWIKFASALESKNISYLKANSLDSIKCTECECGPAVVDELFPSEFIFQKCLAQLMHLKTLTNEEFDSSENDGVIHVNYHIKSKNAEEGGYNLIFYFVKTRNGYKFQGVLVT